MAFLESSVCLIPPDLLMIPMILARPSRAFGFAALCTAASVLGGIAGCWIGACLFEQVGRPMLEFDGKDARFDEFSAIYNGWGAWAVLIAGVTPFPFKVIAILSGSAGLSVPASVAASAVARGLRFFVVSAFLWNFGPPVRDFIEQPLGPVSGRSSVVS